MPVSEQDLWQLAVQARLFSAAAQARLAAKFQAKRGAAPPATAQDLAHWLVRKRVITSYQAKVLLAGRPGPFVYGKYLVIDGIREGRLSGLFRALHRPTRCPVLLEFLESPPPDSAAWRQAVERSAQRRGQDTRLARCYELVHKPPYAFAVLESLHGQAVASLAGAGMAAAQACALARETALTLDELHAGGETHGRVSPENLWLDEKLGPRLLRLPTARDQTGTAAGDVRALADLLRALLGTAERTPELERVLQWLAPSDPQATPSAREAAAALLPLSAPLPVPAPQRSRRRAAYLAWLEERPSTEREAAAEKPASPAAFQPPQISPDAAIAAVDFHVQPRTSERSARAKRASSGTTPLVAALVVTAGLAIVAGLLVWSLWPAESERPPVKSEVTGVNKAPNVPTTAAGAPGDAGPAPDDGVSLWAPPTAGQPLDLELLASGAQLLLAVRPAELWASPEGQRLLGSAETLGFDPSGWLESATGLPVDELESVLLAVYAREAGALDVSLVVRTRQAVPALPSRWPGAQPSPVDAGTAYQSDGWSYFIPTNGERRFAVGSPAMIREIASASGPPLLRRELEGLLSSTDQNRQFTLLVAPAYFFSAGQGVFTGGAQGLELPLRQFLGEGLSAAALSVHVPGDDLFVELRAVGRADTRARTLAADLVARLQALPDQVEAAARSSSLSPYSRELVLDLPRMLEELANYTRSDVEQGQAVLRAYLPARAAHNLSLGGALLALETGSSGGVPDSTPPPATKPLAERLGQPISLVFPRETLEAALQQWGEAAGVPISVVGADLEAESITRNQSFGLDLTNQPAEEVLRQILLLASPEGKLVYVIRAAGAGEESPSLVVTTRAAAQRRGETLPAEFGPAR